MSTFQSKQIRQPLSLSGSFTGSLLGTASYVANSPTLQTVLEAGNAATSNIRLAGGSLIIDSLLNSVLYYQDTNTGNSLTLTTPTLTGTNTLNFPLTNGTLITSINGYTPNASGSVTIPTGSFTGSYTGSFTGSLLGSASYALTASYALNAGTTFNTGSFVTTSSFNSYTSSASSTFAGTSATASFVTLTGLGITVNGTQLTASVRSVNGVSPINGNVATTLTAVTTGT